VEPDETVIATVTSGTGYVVGSTKTATGTITNDDTSVSISPVAASVTEDNASNLNFTISRQGVLVGALTVNLQISGAASLSDYAIQGAATFDPATGTATVGIPAGATSTTLSFDPVADAALEANETVIVTLATTAGYSLGTDTVATGTIVDDDPN